MRGYQLDLSEALCYQGIKLAIIVLSALAWICHPLVVFQPFYVIVNFVKVVLSKIVGLPLMFLSVMLL